LDTKPFSLLFFTSTFLLNYLFVRALQEKLLSFLFFISQLSSAHIHKDSITWYSTMGKQTLHRYVQFSFFLGLIGLTFLAPNNPCKVSAFVVPVQQVSRQTVKQLVRPLQSTTEQYKQYEQQQQQQQQQQQEEEEEEPTPLLVNFPNATELSEGPDGYSINGYTGNAAYQNDLNTRGGLPQPALLGRNAVANNLMDEFDEDGYGDMRSKTTKRSILERIVKFPFRALDRISGIQKVLEPGNLILVRHGESLWNANKTFTGWADPDLSPDGVREVEHAARLLLEGGWDIDLVFTSRLKRAIRSSWIILQELNQVYLPVFKSWRLNER